MARNRQPTVLKVLKGTLDKRWAPPHEPKSTFAIPAKPKGLPAEEAAAWDRFAEAVGRMRTCTAQDFAAFSELVGTYCECQQLRRFIRKNGHTYETVNVKGERMVRWYPEAQLLNQVSKRLRDYLSRFGLSPSDRSRVTDLGAVLGDNRNLDDEFVS